MTSLNLHDGDTDTCPDCGRLVHFTSANDSYGVWFHEDGRENCDG